MAEENHERHSALLMHYRAVHKITDLRSASVLSASVKQRSGKHCVYGIDQVSSKIFHFRSI